MKICLSAANKDENGMLNQTFGRCNYFFIFDTENDSYEFYENPGITSNHGAGIAASNFVVEKGVKKIITGNLGPNAINILLDNEIECYKGEEKSLMENIKELKNGKLTMLKNATKKGH